MKILIAEDNEIIRKLYCALLTSWGFDYDIATNGLEAVQFAQNSNGKYDLCLMDVQMPEMNGIEAAKIIRNTVKYFPIMAFTSNPDYKAACFQAGMDDFILKPCAADELFEKIRSLYNKSIYFESTQSNSDVTEVIPVEKKHSDELRELSRKGLCKMRLIGSGAHDVTFTVHKHVPNNISHDFIEEELEISTFIDRNKISPAECYIYKSSCLIPVVLLDEDQYAEKFQREDVILESRKRLITEKKRI